VAIGVYRIFFSHTWTHADTYGKIMRLLDQVPEFLFRTDEVPPGDPSHGASTEYELRSAIRVAMTHSHVMLALAGVEDCYGRWLAQEIDLARAGFRRRIPVLAVAPYGPVTEASLLASGADRVVPWEKTAIAGGIQELAETAAAETRKAAQSGLLRPVRRSPSQGGEAGEAAEPKVRAAVTKAPPSAPDRIRRSMPVAEVGDALAMLKAVRARLRTDQGVG
jgi:hypothetical protein